MSGDAGTTPAAMEKVAWVHLLDGRMLVARNHGRQLFYLPGGRREPGESDADTLAREVAEELGVDIDVGTMEHLVTCVARRDRSTDLVRMTCYRAAHRGDPAPQREIAELAWIGSAAGDRVTDAERQVLSVLRDRGLVADPPVRGD